MFFDFETVELNTQNLFYVIYFRILDGLSAGGALPEPLIFSVICVVFCFF